MKDESHLNPDPNEQPYFATRPDEQDHPFTMVPNDLIRDASIDPETKWFISYLLSHVERWKLYVPHIMQTQNLSKNKVYNLIKKAIATGYLSRETYIVFGHKRYRYQVSRTAYFKKSLLFPQKRDTEKRDTVNGDTKEYQSLEKTKKKEYIPSPSARELTDLLFNAIQKIKPSFRDPNVYAWCKDFETWMSVTGHTLEDIKKVIAWLPTNDFWSGVILSPKNLRKQFDRLELEMQKTTKKSSSIASNETFAYKVWNYFKKIGKENEVHVGPTYIEFVGGPYIKFTDHGFEEQILSYLRKSNIPIKL